MTMPGTIGIEDGPVECDCCLSTVDAAIRFRNADPLKYLYTVICFRCIRSANAVRMGYEGDFK